MRSPMTVAAAFLLWAVLDVAGAQQRLAFEPGSQVTITRQGVLLRTGPRQLGRHGLLNTGDVGTVLDTSGNWVHLQTTNGRDGWVKRDYLRSVPQEVATPPDPVAGSNVPDEGMEPSITGGGAAAAGPRRVAVPRSLVAASAPPRAPSSIQAAAPAKAAAVAAKPPAAGAPPAGANRTEPSGPTATETPASAPPAGSSAQPKPEGPLAAARPDPLANARPTTAATLGDGLRMVLVLLPVLAVTVLGLRLLRRFQGRLTVLPGIKQGLLGGLVAANARESGGASIRVLESVPIGAMCLHLVEVRGKQLLIGSTAQHVTLLRELEPPKSPMEDDFVAVMNRARRDLGLPVEDDHENPQAPSSLEETIRAAREAIVRQGRRTTSV